MKDDRITGEGTMTDRRYIKLMRVAFLAICTAALYAGLFRESHSITALNTANSAKLNGPAFTEVATYDGLAAKGGRLYDIYSISGISVKADDKGKVTSGAAGANDSTKTKDCKT
jgi:hypothetical protein